MSKLFLPISIVAGLAAGQIAKKLFAFVWGRVADEEAPDPKHREIALGRLALALVLEGAIAKVVRGLADHGLRHAWAGSVGEWPGEERPEPE